MLSTTSILDSFMMLVFGMLLGVSGEKMLERNLIAGGEGVNIVGGKGVWGRGQVLVRVILCLDFPSSGW